MNWPQERHVTHLGFETPHQHFHLIQWTNEHWPFQLESTRALLPFDAGLEVIHSSNGFGSKQFPERKWEPNSTPFSTTQTTKSLLSHLSRMAGDCLAGPAPIITSSYTFFLLHFMSRLLCLMIWGVKNCCVWGRRGRQAGQKQTTTFFGKTKRWIARLMGRLRKKDRKVSRKGDQDLEDCLTRRIEEYGTKGGLSQRRKMASCFRLMNHAVVFFVFLLHFLVTKHQKQIKQMLKSWELFGMEMKAKRQTQIPTSQSKESSKLSKTLESLCEKRTKNSKKNNTRKKNIYWDKSCWKNKKGHWKQSLRTSSQKTKTRNKKTNQTGNET